MPFDVRDLPGVNAALNGLSAVLLTAGLLFIRSGRRTAHKRCMLAALACSALFLTSYLVYHSQVGSVPFTRHGPIRTAYFAILISHVVLATALLPLALTTVWPALHGRFDRHRRLARITFPIWAYVSVTGVVIYWMLYRL